MSILEIGEGVFEVKATHGDTFLGGEDFDQRVMDYLADEFKKDQGIDLRKDRMALQRLKEAAEKAKCELSTVTETDINLPFITADQSGPKHLTMKLTRAKLEALCADLLDRLEGPCVTALKDAGLTTRQIDEVVLVGGMTRMPAVQARVKKLFSKEPHRGVNPDEVMTRWSKSSPPRKVSPWVAFTSKTPSPISRIDMSKVPPPRSKTAIFSTAADNQSAVTIRVFQGEREMAADNKLLGQFDLVGIPPAPRGIPQVEVTFDIDANGIVHVGAKDLGTGKEQSIQITASSGLAKDEIERMVKEAELHADEDKRKREVADARNQLDSLVYQTEKTLAEHGGSLDAASRSAIDGALADAKKALESQDAGRMQTATDALARASHKLAESMYAKASQGGHGADTDRGQQPPGDGPTADGKSKEDVVEAEFEEVKE